MRKLAQLILYEGQHYMETDPIGKREIEKVFQGIMLLEKEILQYEDARINVLFGGAVHIYGVPEALQKRMMDALDDELWYRLHGNR